MILHGTAFGQDWANLFIQKAWIPGGMSVSQGSTFSRYNVLQSKAGQNWPQNYRKMMVLHGFTISGVILKLN